VVFHDIAKNSASEVDHVFSSRRVVDLDFEFLDTKERKNASEEKVDGYASDRVRVWDLRLVVTGRH